MNVKLLARTVAIINGMPSVYGVSLDQYIIQCARVSSPENRDSHKTAPVLLRFLINSKHWSPFEMVNMSFEVTTTRAIGTQLLRHRSLSFQEYSQRYAAVEVIEPIELRRQAAKNRQSSSDVITNPILNGLVKFHSFTTLWLYKLLIRFGVAKECARFVLPLAAQTTLIMNGTLRSWIHFLDQRCNDHAQKEIRLIAIEIKKQLAKLLPDTAKALEWN